MTKKILVIDDDEYIRDLYEEILKEEGFLVDTSVNGEDGLSKIEAGDYDLILLDVMMPKMDGVEVLRQLKAKRLKKNVGPIVLLTNLVNDPATEETKTLGARDYLIKADLNPDQLVKKIKSYMK